MAVLSDSDRVIAWKALMAKIDNLGHSTQLLKSEVRELINAADSFIDSNATTYNQTISQPTRGKATNKEKAAALLFAISKRFEVT